MRHLRFLIAIIIFSFYSEITFAQVQAPDFKFGKVSKGELKMKEYAPDPSAEAVVLYDKGEARLDFNESAGWRVIFDRECRIKIFNQSGFDWATEKVYLYDAGTADENISGLKAYTYNLIDGKIEKDKLDKDNIFENKHSDNVNVHKFTMPNVKAGSVIEFKYTIYSDYVSSLVEWEFQKAIPVAWSELRVKIPEYFKYLHLSQGYERFDIATQESDYGGDFYGERFTNEVYKWAIKDVPALKDEDFISSAEHFYQKLEFQLATVHWPSGKFENILGTWDKINKRLLESSEFGNQVKSRGFYKETLEEIISPEFTDAQKAKAIYSYVSNNVKWNNNYGYWPDDNIKRALNEKTGDVAQINMLVISMLDAVDIEAHPVITSTRNHGLVNPIHPIIGKYNYLIAEAIIDGKSVLIDATEKGLPLGVLPYRSLNQLGRRISREKPEWVGLDPIIADEQMSYFNLALDEAGMLSGTCSLKKGGYAAFDTRSEIDKDGKEKYLENFKESKPDWKISNHKFEELEDIYTDLTESFDIEFENGAMAAGNMMYISPLIGSGETENPFKKEKRKLPIDFVNPISEKNIVVINLPEGYQIEEIPESIQLATPDNSCQFKYIINTIGNKVQVSYILNISKSFYGPERYQELREFFDIIVSKSNEQVVLKKI